MRLILNLFYEKKNKMQAMISAKALFLFPVFAIQNGGACLGDPSAERMFNQYGESSACKEGKGGPFVNDVYRLTDSGACHIDH